MKQLFKRLGIPVLALAALLAMFTPTPASAAVRFGVYLGGPAYPYAYQYGYPYSEPYYAPYAYGGYPYGYLNPYYDGFYWGGGHGHHEHREFRGGGHGFHAGGHEFHGGGHGGHRR